MSDSRRTRRTLAGLVLAAVLAGCTGVPVTGPVVYHTPPPERVAPDVLIAPLPPTDGADPALIVDGFLHAMSVYQPDYAIARLYLTESANAAWRPLEGVQIYADGWPPTLAEDNVLLSAPLVGKLNERGEYAPASSGQRVRQDFKLIRDGQGQWRITNPPEGLLISRYLFASGYVGVDLHHCDPSGTMLIPEPIWVPAGAEQHSRVLAAQLAGPSVWLAPLAMDVPALRLEAVSVTQGTAVVRVSGADGLSPQQRQAALLGLIATATRLSGVSQVELLSGGVAWTLPGHAGTRFTARDVADVNPGSAGPPGSLVAVREGRVQTASVQDPAGGATVAPGVRDPRSAAVSARLDLVAAVVDDGETLVTSAFEGEDVTEVRAGVGLLRPQFSRDELWTADASGVSSFQVFTDDGPTAVSVPNPSEEAAPHPPAGALVAFSLSPEGDRLAVAVAGATGAEIGLLRVGRSDGPEPKVTLDGWRPLVLSSAEATTVIDLGWSTQTELLVLVADDQGSTSVVRASQDGAVSAEIGPSATVRFAELAVSPQHTALLRSEAGLIYRYDADFSWPLWLTGVQAISLVQ